MSNRRSDDELIRLYYLSKEVEESGYMISRHEKIEAKDQTLIRQFNYRYYFLSKKSPAKHKYLIDLANRFIQLKADNPKLLQKTFLKQYAPDTIFSLFQSTLIHISYKLYVDNLIKNTTFVTRKSEPMPSDKETQLSFIPVIPSLTNDPIIKEEIVPEKNSIEIIIKKGVKVILEPNVDTSVIIKIIDLLKEV